MTSPYMESLCHLEDKWQARMSCSILNGQFANNLMPIEAQLEIRRG